MNLNGYSIVNEHLQENLTSLVRTLKRPGAFDRTLRIKALRNSFPNTYRKYRSAIRANPLPRA